MKTDAYEKKKATLLSRKEKLLGQIELINQQMEKLEEQNAKKMNEQLNSSLRGYVHSKEDIEAIVAFAKSLHKDDSQEADPEKKNAKTKKKEADAENASTNEPENDVTADENSQEDLQAIKEAGENNEADNESEQPTPEVVKPTPNISTVGQNRYATPPRKNHP